MVAGDCGVGGMGSYWSKGKHFSYVGWTGSGDLAHSMVTIVNNTVLYTEKKKCAKKEGGNAHAHQWQPSEIMDMVISLAVVIISQSMHISKHHILHHKIYHLVHLLFLNKAGKLKVSDEFHDFPIELNNWFSPQLCITVA